MSRLIQFFVRGALLLPAAVIMAASGAQALDELPTGKNNRGMITITPYVIFPENRPGNGVYLNNRSLLTLKDKTIVRVVALPSEGRFVYLALTSKGQKEVGVVMAQGDPPAKLESLDNGIYYLVAIMEGRTIKKLVREVRGANLVDLLPYSNTADGVSLGQEGIAFYHVRPKMTEGPNNGAFPLGLHLALFNEERVRHLPYNFYLKNPVLTLEWKGAKAMLVKGLDGGKSEEISISQFR